jgi:hypothetical protein
MITPEQNIVLAGFSGTGKTVVGELSAGRLRRRFLDDRNYELLGKSGVITALRASPETIQ